MPAHGKAFFWQREMSSEPQAGKDSVCLKIKTGLFLESRGIGERVTGWSHPGHSRGLGFDFSSDGMPLEGAASVPRKTPWAFCGEVTP